MDATDNCHECSVIGEVSWQGEALEARVNILRKHEVRSGDGHHAEVQFRCDDAVEPLVLAAPKSTLKLR